jgi:hypothetical protein
MRHRAVRLAITGMTLTVFAARLALADDAGTTCATAMTRVRPVPLLVTETVLEAARPPSGVLQLGTFDIVLVPGPGLSGNPAALAAFERAAQQWEAVISDPIVVTINADFAAIGAADVIGQASSVLLMADFNSIRNAVVGDAAADTDDGIVSSMPTEAQFTASVPAGVSLAGNLGCTKANLKALGFPGLDGTFGASDASITFNNAFSFDLDNSDGVSPGTVDFETVAAHEIGHALGFTSAVDTIDTGSTTDVVLRTLDLYRFANDTVNDPATAAEFSTFARSLTPGMNEIFDDIAIESRMSTGVNGGDGRQASHWKDDALTGSFIGLMDPTLPSGTVEPITTADKRALDLIGYDIVLTVPTTTTTTTSTTTTSSITTTSTTATTAPTATTATSVTTTSTSLLGPVSTTTAPTTTSQSGSTSTSSTTPPTTDVGPPTTQPTPSCLDRPPPGFDGVDCYLDALSDTLSMQSPDALGGRKAARALARRVDRARRLVQLARRKRHPLPTLRRAKRQLRSFRAKASRGQRRQRIAKQVGDRLLALAGEASATIERLQSSLRVISRP